MVRKPNVQEFAQSSGNIATNLLGFSGLAAGGVNAEAFQTWHLSPSNHLCPYVIQGCKSHRMSSLSYGGIYLDGKCLVGGEMGHQ